MDPILETKGWLDAIVRAAIKNTIQAHGPITASLVGSAAKRIAGDVRSSLKRELPNAEGHTACRLRVADLEERLAALEFNFRTQVEYWMRKANVAEQREQSHAVSSDQI
jgi:hypothetical protein